MGHYRSEMVCEKCKKIDCICKENKSTCPSCGKEWEPCYLCRIGDNHQQCFDDKKCHDCLMEDEFRREDRYIVLKRTDLNYISSDGKAKLSEICKAVEINRKELGKKAPLKCVVVEEDWPEYEEVWALIKRRMSK